MIRTPILDPPLAFTLLDSGLADIRCPNWSFDMNVSIGIDPIAFAMSEIKIKSFSILHGR